MNRNKKGHKYVQKSPVTTAMAPELWKQVRMMAAEKDLPIFVLFEEAITQFLAQNQPLNQQQ